MKRYMDTFHSGVTGHTSFQTEEARRRKVIDLLTEETENTHRDVSKKLLQFAVCTHNGTPLSAYPYSPCSSDLDGCFTKLQEQNTIVVRLIGEVSRVRNRAPGTSRLVCNIADILLDAKLRGLEMYKAQASNKIDTSVSKYWI